MPTGSWFGAVDSPGGPIPLSLELAGDPPQFTIRNATERAVVPRTEHTDAGWRLFLDPYPASIELSFTTDAERVVGTWQRERRGGEVDSLPLRLLHEGKPAKSIPGDAPALDGRWRVTFSSDPDGVAVGVFETVGTRIHGTILTALGDYRYLEGYQDEFRFELGCVDGTHAFRFSGRIDDDGAIQGDFWSGGTWHETFEATRDPDVALPDAWAASEVVDAAALADLTFPDLDGKPTRLGDLGTTQIVSLFGSWCPNCNDEAPLLQSLWQTHGSNGLSVVGLAFEHSGDPAKDRPRVRRFADKHGVTYPLLLAGSFDKEAASASFPVLDRVRAFPTTLFVQDGKVVKVHTGFAGPATGPAHELLVSEWRKLGDDLVGTP
jgi:thiol-disulfide isomerase/thioredoxin